MKFHGAVNINPTILRSAIIKGRTKTKNSGRRLNATVATLLSAWFTDEELSKMSLAGKACPSIPGSKPKVKFDEEILDAITRKPLNNKSYYALIKFINTLFVCI